MDVRNLQQQWKPIKTENRTTLTKMYIVDSLDEAMKTARIVAKLAKQFNEDKDNTQISISARNVLIILNAYRNHEISGNIYQLTKAIDDKIQR
jgi:hypothetical protein